MSEKWGLSTAYRVAMNLREWARQDLPGRPDSAMQATGGFIAARFVEAQEQKIQRLEKELEEERTENNWLRSIATERLQNKGYD